MEKTITKKIMKALTERGYFCIKIHGGPFQVAGLPDILVIKDGLAVWLEVKQPGKHATKLQQAMITKLIRCGCWAGVVHNVNEALELIGEEPIE